MADKHAQLKQAIVDVFERMNRRYGYRRVHAQLCREGWVVNHKLVYKLMDQLGLKSKIKAKKKYNSYKGTVSNIANNVLNRCFTPDEPNTVWQVTSRSLALLAPRSTCRRSWTYAIGRSCRTAFQPHRIRRLRRNLYAMPSRKNHQIKVCLYIPTKDSNISIPAGAHSSQVSVAHNRCQGKETVTTMR